MVQFGTMFSNNRTLYNIYSPGAFWVTSLYFIYISLSSQFEEIMAYNNNINQDKTNGNEVYLNQYTSGKYHKVYHKVPIIKIIWKESYS